MARRTTDHKPTPGDGHSDTASQRAPRGGRVYELIVLGELSDGPHHGYLLREIIGQVLGRFRQVSWGVLYPLLHRLETEHLIAPEARAGPEAGSKGGPRRRYRITPSGRVRHLELMLELGAYTAHHAELFQAKLGYFDRVGLEQQAAILMHHLAYLQRDDDHLRASREQVLGNARIPQRERQRIAWVIGYRLERVRAEVIWVERALRELSASSSGSGGPTTRRRESEGA